MGKKPVKRGGKKGKSPAGTRDLAPRSSKASAVRGGGMIVIDGRSAAEKTQKVADPTTVKAGIIITGT